MDTYLIYIEPVFPQPSCIFLPFHPKLVEKNLIQKVKKMADKKKKKWLVGRLTFKNEKRKRAIYLKIGGNEEIPKEGLLGYTFDGWNYLIKEKI